MEDPALLICPRCRSRLTVHTEEWRCDACLHAYRSLRGIPDLRTADDAYLRNDADWAFALRLNAEYDRRDFRGLLEHYYDLSLDVPRDLRARQIGHILDGPERLRRQLEGDAWLRGLTSCRRPREVVLDLGCGTGSALVALARGADNADVRRMWGVDIALRWLLVARKRLEEEGFGGIRLVCACAERLPFADEQFTGVLGGDVIEHVADQPTTLAESYRVLKPGGRLFLATPNRFSLGPEPHVNVWGVGYLPRPWMAAYVRRMRGTDFRAIRTLHVGEWRRMLARSPFGGGRIETSPLGENELSRFGAWKRLLGRAYNATLSTSLGRVFWRAFGPYFTIACTRPERASRPTPATRRSSTPTGVSR
jgi:SAM-dependent methyltransferase